MNLGSTRWSGLRGDADRAAEAIADVAGLPPPPPRREINSRKWAWVLLAAAIVCFGVGLYCGPLLSITHPSLPFALREVSVIPYSVGMGMLHPAFRITRDHRRKRGQ